MAETYPEKGSLMITADSILRDLEALAYRTVRTSHPEKTALACSRALFECLFINFRKHYLYVPTRNKDAILDKHEAIWADFKGRNHFELSIKYHMSVQQIYNIIGQMRSTHIRQRQQDLFPLPEETRTKPLTLVVLEDYLPHDLHRAGLPFEEASQLAGLIADYLCNTYPGLSIRITESLRQKRQGGNVDLFAESA